METNIFEYCIVSGFNGYINDILKAYYNEGWREAGASCVFYHDHVTSQAKIYIPLKREIKTKQNGE